MKLIHTTPLRNLKSILQYGILCSYARQGRRAVWMHDEKQRAWAENHVRLKHYAINEDVVHITVNVPKSKVKKHAKGLYYIYEDIRPEQIKLVRKVRTVVEVMAI